VSPRVAIVGGGVSGLAAAHRLVGAEPTIDVMVVEATERLGGKLATGRVGDLVLPTGADSFVARKPWAVDLCRELGLTDLVAPAATAAWLWTQIGLVPYATGTAFGIPADVGGVFRWPGLSVAGRRRALLDLVKRRRKTDGDETLGSLLRRRLGDEATDRAIGPLLAGLHAGDVDSLSVQATFPELQGWERTQGSLVRGAQAALRPARSGANLGPMFLRPRDGVEALPRALAAALGGRIRTGAPAVRLVRQAAAWRLTIAEGEPLDVDAVVLSTPAEPARQLLAPVARTAADELDAIPSVSTAVVLMVSPSGSADALPDGTGFVVPRGKAPMTACTWLSRKWPDPSFGTRAVTRCFVGAAGEEDVLDAGDAEIVEACARHLAALLPLPAEPEAAAVVRWPRSMPQYQLGHRERVARIREHLPPGIFVTGQAFDGVGVADCIRTANETAAAVGVYLRKTDAQRHDQETVR
jgi:protoporphyrinogen/coproporphyrinogen III oxidase